MKLGVVGGGAWGTALAQVASSGGRDTLLWALEDDVVAVSGDPLFTLGGLLGGIILGFMAPDFYLSSKAGGRANAPNPGSAAFADIEDRVRAELGLTVAEPATV